MNSNRETRQGVEDDVTFDVVCGQAVDTAANTHQSRYRGATYYFCCGGCRRSFESAPHTFVHARTYGPFH